MTSSRGGLSGGRGASAKNSARTGNPGDFGIAEISQRRSKIDRGGADPLADQPVGQAGHGIRFKGQSGHAPQQCRQHRRPGSISTHTDHHLRLPAAQQPHAVQDAARQRDQGLELGGQADAVELADIDELEGIAGLRHQARFHAPVPCRRNRPPPRRQT